MNLALDTNAYSAAARGEERFVALTQSARHIYLPFIVVAELRAGFAAGALGRRNESILARFLASSRVSVLYPDEQTTHHYAHLYAQLRRQGTPIPTNDIWIAAIVLQYDLALLTNDAHFSKIPQLARA
ncbi:MAG: type II toxin-antitoxin system VapC family toxin [Polyangiaceae bacterium]|nr:type II toxin-antitoxin system VapC family toxin [Polyangiaceae bacterium]